MSSGEGWRASSNSGGVILRYTVPVYDATATLLGVAFGERNANGTYYPSHGSCEDRCRAQSYAVRAADRLAATNHALLNAPVPAPVVGAPLVFSVLGDWGRLGVASQTATAGGMATAVAAWNATFVLTVGDNFYGASRARVPVSPLVPFGSVGLIVCRPRGGLHK